MSLEAVGTAGLEAVGTASFDLERSGPLAEKRSEPLFEKQGRTNGGRAEVEHLEARTRVSLEPSA